MKNMVIDGVESKYYFIDVNGNIENKHGHQMTPFISNSGYARVKLTVGCERGMYSVHRPLAETYLENPKNFPIVNHLNSIRDDNRVENLQWATNSMNQLQRFRENGHEGTKRRPVAQICLYRDKVIREWGSAIDATREIGVANQNIYKVCRGQRQSAGGYGWKYI